MSRTRKGRMVADTANPVDLGSRTAWWLRSAGLSAKEVARVVGQSEGIGKRLRNGVPPTTAQFTKLARHFGWRFVAFALEAALGPDDTALATDLNDIKTRLARLEALDDELDRADSAAAASGPGKVAHGPCRAVDGLETAARGPELRP